MLQKIADIPQFSFRLTIANISEHIYVQCFCLFDNQMCNGQLEVPNANFTEKGLKKTQRMMSLVRNVIINQL